MKNNKFSRFTADQHGGIIVPLALTLPVLFGAVGSSVDYSLAAKHTSSMQAAADAGALAGARQLTLGASDAAIAADAAKSIATAALKGDGVSKAEIQASLTPDKLGVEVKITTIYQPYFMQVLSIGDFELKVKAVARSSTSAVKICVVGLDPQAGNTIQLDSNALLTANDCSVFSNSRSSAGLRSESNAILKAQTICSSGGKAGGNGNYSPKPQTDCPPVPDPLASRPPPPVGGCDFNALVVKDVTKTLSPGVYCGGLTIDGNAKVKLTSGIYVMKDGPFIVDSNAQVQGEYVGFYFTGKNSRFRFTSNASVSVGAPKDGPMAGVLFWEDRNAPQLQKFEIHSNYTRNLLGTIYLPQGRFIVDANQAVADQSAYTAIIVRRLELFAGPNLVVNAKYDQTDVPVPEGVGPIAGKTRLVE